MKKGFTMIELIFVIVILGILASVAIPRLAATRDDAEVVKMGTNLTTLISDIGAYYTSKGEFSTNITDMTNVAVYDKTSGTLLTSGGMEGSLLSANKKCINYKIVAASETSRPSYIEVTEGGDASQPICQKVLDLDSIKKIMDAKVTPETYKAGEDGKTGTWTKGEAVSGYQLSGTSVVF